MNYHDIYLMTNFLRTKKWWLFSSRLRADSNPKRFWQFWSSAINVNTSNDIYSNTSNDVNANTSQPTFLIVTLQSLKLVLTFLVLSFKWKKSRTDDSKLCYILLHQIKVKKKLFIFTTIIAAAIHQSILRFASLNSFNNFTMAIC